jgi:hypothetical protein
MAYEVSWYMPKRVIITRMSGDVDLQEVRESHMVITQLGEEVSHRVHVIMDMSGVTTFPTSLMRLSRVLGTVDDRRFGWVLIVSSDPVLRFLLTTLGKLMKARMRIFNESESAFDFLAIADSQKRERYQQRYNR